MPQGASLLRLFTADLRAKAVSTVLVPLRRRAQTVGIDADLLQQPKKSVCVCLGKTPPQQRLPDLVSQSSKRDSKEYFSMSPSTISQIKIKQEAGTSLCSWFMSMGISILHLNKNERLQQSFRKILETTSWCVLALWKIISSLIPGTVFVSNPSHSPNFANRCTNAGLNTTEISNSLHMQRTEERRKELVENYTTQCWGPLWWWRSVTEQRRVQFNTKQFLLMTVVNLIVLTRRKENKISITKWSKQTKANTTTKTFRALRYLNYEKPSKMH